MSKVEVSAREAEATAARERFMATLHEVQQRLSPGAIAADVKQTVRDKADGAISAAKDGVAQAATHPSTVAAVTIPLLVYFFRKPLGKTLSALFGRKDPSEPEIQPYEAARAPAPPPESPPARSPRAAALTEQGA